ncbi:MAG: hypothetical protein P0116_08555 [Candidatus Nitrosocosmicus sp.]|nr:hypothetical protein [Candidatus Nitrosocosmicus sp.]
MMPQSDELPPSSLPPSLHSLPPSLPLTATVTATVTAIIAITATSSCAAALFPVFS